jgi:DNA recombination protein RmuC
MDAADVIVVVGALVFGMVCGVLVLRVRTAGAAGAATASAERDSAASIRAEIESSRDRLAERLEQTSRELRESERAQVRLETQLDDTQKAAQDKLVVLRGEQDKLSERFKLLSAEALQANREQFLQLATQQFQGVHAKAQADLDQRRGAVETLVKPLGEQLSKFSEQVRSVEHDRTQTYAALREQVTTMSRANEQLRAETHHLVSALKKPQTRGQWGERALRNVVEAAGMLERVDFDPQVSVSTTDGLLRPDMVIKLGGGKTIVVDAKAPFAAFLEAQDARDEDERAARLLAHARHVKAHINDLASKQYWAQFPNCPEFVVMFLPAESFLYAAEDQDPGLWEYACRNKVILATPANLVTMLRTVAYMWRQEAIADSAQRVLTLGRDLYERLSKLGDHVGKLGRALESTVTAYNSTVGTLESRVFVTARRLTELKIVDTDLRPPVPIDARPRGLRAPELQASEPHAVEPLTMGHAS